MFREIKFSKDSKYVFLPGTFAMTCERPNSVNPLPSPIYICFRKSLQCNERKNFMTLVNPCVDGKPHKILIQNWLLFVWQYIAENIINTSIMICSNSSLWDYFLLFIYSMSVGCSPNKSSFMCVCDHFLLPDLCDIRASKLWWWIVGC